MHSSSNHDFIFLVRPHNQDYVLQDMLCVRDYNTSYSKQNIYHHKQLVLFASIYSVFFF